MGAWGTGLYQDDVTCDIKEEYLNWLRVGKSNIEATQIVINYNMDFINDEEDGPLFWFALADTQWKYGRLLPEVKEEALKQIEEGKDLLRWQENKKQYLKRKKVLEELKQKLNSPQPEEKKVTKIKMSKALWNIGDVLLYQIQNEELKNHKWYGKYVLFRVVGITRTNIGSLPQNQYYNEQNVLALYNWVGEKWENIDKIDELEFIELKNQNIWNRKQKDYMMTIAPTDGKKINLHKVKEEESFKYIYENTITGIGIAWEDENSIDYAIVRALGSSENDGTLKNETVN